MAASAAAVTAAAFGAENPVLDRNSYPTNLLTVRDWQQFAAVIEVDGWQAAMAHYAEVSGRAFCLRMDGSLRAVAMVDGKPRAKTFRQGGWRWLGQAA